MLWKQEVTLTVDSADSDRYPLPPRTRQVIKLKDTNGDLNPLGTYRSSSGYVLEEGARTARLRSYTVVGSLKAWIIQEPVNISASTVDASAGTNTITLVASPSVGSTVVQDDYYNGAWLTIASGDGVGEIKRIRDYDGGTQVATLDTAWTTPPTVAGASVYSIMTDLPQAAVMAQVLRAALLVMRTDEVMQEFRGTIMEDYAAAHRDALVLLNNANMPKVDQPVRISSMGSDDTTGEYT